MKCERECSDGARECSRERSGRVANGGWVVIDRGSGRLHVRDGTRQRFFFFLYSKWGCGEVEGVEVEDGR